MGTNAVGQVVKSKTTHVFYVLDSLATEFETALKVLGTIHEIKKPGADNEDVA